MGIPNFITRMNVSENFSWGDMRNNIIIMCDSLISTIWIKMENIIGHCLIAYSRWSKSIECYFRCSNFNFVLNVNSGHSCQSCSKRMPCNQDWSCRVLFYKIVHCSNYLRGNCLISIIKSTVNFCSSYSRERFPDKIEVSDPIRNVNRPSECDNYLVVFNIESNIPECTFCFIVNERNALESRVRSAWLSTWPSLD